MRICKSKTDLKKSTRVEVSVRNAGMTNCTILDGCAILWSIAGQRPAQPINWLALLFVTVKEVLFVETN